ncbi:MAG: hypothetical protein ACR2NI_01310, partial [Pirellulales bacterium]
YTWDRLIGWRSVTFRFSGYPDRYKPAPGHMVHPFGRSGTGGLGVLRASPFWHVIKVCGQSVVTVF